MGNQLTPEKVKHINSLPSKLYEEPEVPELEDMEVVDEERLEGENTKSNPDQPTLF